MIENLKNSKLISKVISVFRVLFFLCRPHIFCSFPQYL
nr:MAG TPA_asm: hypothetical protein [Caudoviricetes sp.]